MIVLIHGDNQVASRTRFVELREEAENRGRNVTHLDGKKTSWEKITLSAHTPSLLGQESAVFVEEFFTGQKRVVGELDQEVIFWEPRELTKGYLMTLPKTWGIETFSFSRQTFKFLESLSPANTKSNINFLHQVLERDSPEIVLPLLSWHTRQLIWAKEEPDTLSGPSWKTQKLLRQARLFTAEKLYELHGLLTNLDRDVKTGRAPLPLSSSLDLVLLQL